MPLKSLCLLGWLVMLTIAGAPPRTFCQDYATELPRIPPTEPGQTIKSFQIADGYEIQLIASEPLIGSPVAIEWSADGRMYVCEMRGYSENRDDQISTLGLLSDTDGDGVYDKRSEFASGLRWPTAIFPYDAGLFVGDAPDLLYLKDTDGDGVADKREIVLTGFGTSNVQGLMNSMRWGLDNRIHIACSSTGGQISHPESKGKPVNIRGRDLAFDPTTRNFKPTSGAAQHGMCFDDWGRKFTSANSDHIMQVMYDDEMIARNPLLSAPSARVSIAVDGPQAEVFRTSPVEPWRIVRTRLRVSGKASGPIEGGGRAAGYFTGATGVTIYRGDAWPATDKGIAIIGDVGSNLIHRKRLKRNGLQFQAHRIDDQSEFVTSTDIWFRPAQFANAPDGSLHVIDVCREVIEHPKSLPEEIKRHLDLTAGRDRGRIYRIFPTGAKLRRTPDLSESSTDRLVSLLGHANAWHRETASRLLFQRQDPSAIEPLRQLVVDRDHPLATLHAIHVLSGMNALNSGLIASALDHPHAQIRRHAIRLAKGPKMSTAVVARVKTLVNDPSLEVRTALAYAIGDLQFPCRADALAEIAKRDSSKWSRVAIQSSAYDCAADLFSTLVVDSEFRTANNINLLARLATQVSQQDDPTALMTALNAINETLGQESALTMPLVGRLLSKRRDAKSNAAALAAAGRFADTDRRTSQAIETEIQLAISDAIATQRRTTAIASLRYASLDEANPALISLIDKQQPPAIQKAAIQTLDQLNSPNLSETLLDAWASFTPGLRAIATEALLARSDRVATLFDAIDANDFDVRDIPPSRLVLLSKSKDKGLAERARAFVVTTDKGPRDAVVRRYQSALEIAGNLNRGKTIFKKNCSACHKVEGVGHELGPNLAAMKNRGSAAILTNVFDPSREVNPAYMNYLLVTVDGRSVTGMISSETANGITLSRGEGAKETVRRTEIELLQSSGASIMPDGFEDSIDVQSMADLIAYLMQAK